MEPLTCYKDSTDCCLVMVVSKQHNYFCTVVFSNVLTIDFHEVVRGVCSSEEEFDQLSISSLYNLGNLR